MTRAEFMRRMAAAATLGAVPFVAPPPTPPAVSLPDDGEWHHVVIHVDGREVARMQQGGR